MAITVGGVMANLALRHNIGKRVASPSGRGNRVRVTRKERIKLSELLSATHKNGRAKRKAREITRDERPAMGDALSAGPTEETMKLAKEARGSFYQRVAFDSRVPTDLRMESFIRMARDVDVAEGA